MDPNNSVIKKLWCTHIYIFFFSLIKESQEKWSSQKIIKPALHKTYNNTCTIHVSFMNGSVSLTEWSKSDYFITKLNKYTYNVTWVSKLVCEPGFQGLYIL